MKSELFTSAAQKVALAVATAGAVGGGSMLLSDHTINATQDVRIDRLEKTIEKIDALNGKLDAATANIAILNARLEAQHVSRN